MYGCVSLLSYSNTIHYYEKCTTKGMDQKVSFNWTLSLKPLQKGRLIIMANQSSSLS